jgi:hypothetical protein
MQRTYAAKNLGFFKAVFFAAEFLRYAQARGSVIQVAAT